MNISKAEGSLKRLLHGTGNEETVAARGFTHFHSWKAETWWIQSNATSSFLLTTCEVHRHLQTQKNPQAKFQFFRLFFLFQICFFLLHYQFFHLLFFAIIYHHESIVEVVQCCGLQEEILSLLLLLQMEEDNLMINYNCYIIQCCCCYLVMGSQKS